jgi:hypothetical protein
VLSLEADNNFLSSSVKNRRRFYDIELAYISIMLEVETEFESKKYN